MTGTRLLHWRVTLAAVGALLVATGCSFGESKAAVSYPTLVAAGDIACSPKSPAFATGTASQCGQRDTAALIAALRPVAVLPLGDTQYPAGTGRAYAASYAPSWGTYLGITHPAVGNHEYGTPGAKGYFSYFKATAGASGRGWYSYDVGTWHLIALNAECSKVGGCDAGSPEEAWLARDLAQHRNSCVLAYWHQPRFSSGLHGDNAAYAAWWDDLYRAGADVVLNGHDHDYERFAPQTPSAVPDDAHGLREFVVGTGGEHEYAFHTIRANSQARIDHVFGVLQLTLRPDGYSWGFVSAGPGHPVMDSGSGSCH